MKVKDILTKTVDNYYKIVIEIFDRETDLIINRYYIQPHSCDFTNIPESVANMKVEMIIPFYDRLSICVIK